MCKELGTDVSASQMGGFDELQASLKDEKANREAAEVKCMQNIGVTD